MCVNVSVNTSVHLRLALQVVHSPSCLQQQLCSSRRACTRRAPQERSQHSHPGPLASTRDADSKRAPVS